MTSGTPSFTEATRLFVVPRSMPTTLPTGLGLRTTGFGPRARGVIPGARSLEPGAEVRSLALDGCEQVVDVVPLEQPLPQRGQRRSPFGWRCGVLAVPA